MRGGVVWAGIGLLLAGPALAQGTGGVSPGQPIPAPSDSNIRSFTLRNLSNRTITQVHAHLSNDATDLVTAQRAIRPDQAQTFGARGRACLDSVSARHRYEKGREGGAASATAHARPVS